MSPIWFNYVVIALLANSEARRNLKQTRIIGGNDAKISDFPYQVALKYPRSGEDVFDCGGSIISSKVIITAAHCTYGKKARLLRVVAGTSYVNKGGVIRRVSKIIRHSKFKYEMPARYDVALLILNKKLNFSNKIQSIKLATWNLKDNEQVVATGWGLVAKKKFPKILQKVKVRIINQDKCAKMYKKRGKKIKPDMLCAGIMYVGGKDTCSGDSGGPLIKRGKLYGITSGGDGCAWSHSPGIYTRIAAVRDWIKSKVGL